MPIKPTTVGAMLKWGRQKLSYSTTPDLDARILLAMVTRRSQQQLLQDADQKLTDAQSRRFVNLIKKRQEGWPIAYLTGVKEFYGLEVKITPAVLIPRPTTEAIVTVAIQLALGTQAKTIYEIGTGSGAVAIALAKQLPEIKIVVSDVSNPALAVARWNIRHYKLTNQIKTIRSHLGQHIKQPSLIVANLPYLPTSLEPRQELMFEPKLALYADDNGLALYKELFNQTNFTAAVIELGANQYQPMIEWLANKFPRAKIDSVKDIDGTICGLQILAG